MVLIGDQKHACQTCIKGHRSSSCNHADRPLFPIKRKGRPTTQCDHCRELRKTRRVHVKCMCGSKTPSNTERVSRTINQSHYNAAPSLSDGSSSDSDHSSCSCGSTQECHCCIPRVSVPNPTKRRNSCDPVQQADSLITPSNTPPLSWFEEDRLSTSMDRHERIQNASSPYGPAYAAHHQYHSRLTHSSAQINGLNYPNAILTPDLQSPSLCSCSAGCRCLGCANIPTDPLTKPSQCNNPSACRNCFDCLVLSLPLTPEYDLHSGQDFDMWMHQGIAQSTEPLLYDPSTLDLNMSTTSFEPTPPDFASDNTCPLPDLGAYSPIPPFSSFSQFSSKSNLF